MTVGENSTDFGHLVYADKVKVYFLLVALSVNACAQASPFPSLVPTILKLSYSHEMGETSEVEFKEGKVFYKLNKLSGTISGSIEPTSGQWSMFVTELNEAKVYKWDSHYKGQALSRDGGFYWSVELQVGDRYFVSDGNTEFPPDGDIEPSKRHSSHTSFDLFDHAVSDLIGQKFL